VALEPAVPEEDVVPAVPELPELPLPCDGVGVLLPEPLLPFDPELLLPCGVASGSWYWLSPALCARAEPGSASANATARAMSAVRVIGQYS
jgi:hypothetical protein